MGKAYKAIGAVAGRVLFIGFSIQIILGVCWMVCNFTGFQQFAESSLYEEISRTLICDEYEGILYPVLIMLTGGIEKLFRIPYRCILYLLQIGFAFFASYRLLQSVGVKKKRWTIWGSLAMLTFPMAMQCHLAVLPDSLVTTALLAELSFAIAALTEAEQLRPRAFVKVLVFWLLSALLRPEYLYIGGVPVLLLFLYGLAKAWKRDKKRILYNGILMVAFAGLILSVTDLTEVEGYYGRVHKSINFTLAKRAVWQFASMDYAGWPEEVKACVTQAQAWEMEHYADNVERILGEVLEDAVGKERAEELFGELAANAWQWHRDGILHYTMWDIVGYTFSPVVVQLQFGGEAYDAYSGRNYDIMRAHTPVLTSYYMNYGCWWFVVGFVVAALILCLGVVKYLIGMFLCKRKPSANGGKVLGGISCLCSGGLIVLWYTLQGTGTMDYKKNIAVTLLWILGMLICGIAGIQEEIGAEKG